MSDNDIVAEAECAALKRQVRVLERKLARSEETRARLETARDQFDVLQRSLMTEVERLLREKAEELSGAASYLTSLLPEPLTGDLSADWQFIPSAELGGDTFGYAWLDDDHFAMYLLDVCGHGLKAALLSVTAMNVLRNQTLPATDFRSPASVLSGMNDAFQMDRYNNMYFTLWYGVFNRRTRELRYANGGHPSAILVSGATAETAAPAELAGPGMIIGGFPGMEYTELAVALPSYSRLYFFSDGLYEITRTDQTMMSYAEFMQVVGRGPRTGSALRHIIEAIRVENGPKPFDDDLSIVEVTF